MVKLTVNRQRHFHFSKEVETDYGKFEIREQNEIATLVTNFTVDNLMFFEAPSEELLKLSEFKAMLLERDFTPLDIYCARALYENREAMWELRNLWNRLTVLAEGRTQLETIVFLGNVMATHKDDVDHFPVFNYRPTVRDNNVEFIPFEDDPFFRKDRDFILVFKKEFIQNL